MAQGTGISSMKQFSYGPAV